MDRETVQGNVQVNESSRQRAEETLEAIQMTKENLGKMYQRVREKRREALERISPEPPPTSRF